MGQKVSISQEEKNELYNLLQIGQPQQSQEPVKTGPPALMRMIAPTALGPQQRVRQKPSSSRKQRVMQPPAKARRAPMRQSQKVGQRL